MCTSRFNAQMSNIKQIAFFPLFVLIVVQGSNHNPNSFITLVPIPLFLASGIDVTISSKLDGDHFNFMRLPFFRTESRAGSSVRVANVRGQVKELRCPFTGSPTNRKTRRKGTDSLLHGLSRCLSISDGCLRPSLVLKDGKYQYSRYKNPSHVVETAQGHHRKTQKLKQGQPRWRLMINAAIE